MSGRLFRLIFRGRKQPDLSEVEDFLERHGDAIAKAIEPKPLKHHCPFPPGRRLWRFTWKWPFIHTWISNAICCCDVIDILERMSATPERQVITVYVGDMEPEDQEATMRSWHQVLAARQQVAPEA